MRDRPEIFCPSCAYRPRAEDRWSCVPSCGTSFHTFWTRGVCPGCTWRWEKTQCPACGELSAHEAWYHRPIRSSDEARDGVERTAELGAHADAARP